jgi:hypothetical protein
MLRLAMTNAHLHIVQGTHTFTRLHVLAWLKTEVNHSNFSMYGYQFEMCTFTYANSE